jgi:hypothetical protein
MKLVKFGCGCIGAKDGTIFKSCEGEDEYEFTLRPDYILDRNKPGTPLTNDETKKIYDEINVLLRDGYRYRRLKVLLAP